VEVRVRVMRKSIVMAMWQCSRNSCCGSGSGSGSGDNGSGK
jgi:hypothetical protein